MKPQIFNPVRHFILLFAMAPAMVLAQHSEPAPCLSTAVADAPQAEAFVLLSEHITASTATNVTAATAQYVHLVADVASYETEKRKSFEKTYKVGNSDMLAIDNKFGKVHVNTWNRNEIQVKVEMISRAGSEERAQEILDKINVTESREGRTINLKTVMESMSVSGKGKKSFEINYTVHMPAVNPLTVKNSFGSTYVSDFKGETNITVKYGSLKTERLENKSNLVKVAYGSGNCTFINSGTLEIAYSTFNLESTNGIRGFSKYSNFKIGKLEDVLDLELKYGSLHIDTISRNMRKINLASGFSPISLNFADKTSFNFDVNVQFGNFKFDQSQVNVTSLERSHTSAAYKGNFGGASPKGSVSIVSKYGDVRFDR